MNRVIPVLLLHNNGLVKSKKFKDHVYVGDPINTVKIFNDKEVDEIIILDIDASAKKQGPHFEQVAEIISEAFIPLAYGGGISTVEHVKKLFYLGVEKVILNAAAYTTPQLITEISKLVGSQSVIAAMDISKNWLGKYSVKILNGSKTVSTDPIAYARKLEEYGAGELFINFIDRDGTYQGYDLDFVSRVTAAVSIPVIVCGGASSADDFAKAVDAGASAVAAGSMFVFQRPHNAVLISYPPYSQLKELFQKK